jgi:hypothetical protein
MRLNGSSQACDYGGAPQFLVINVFLPRTPVKNTDAEFSGSYFRSRSRVSDKPPHQDATGACESLNESHRRPVVFPAQASGVR